MSSVLVCGGGNAAQVCATLFASRQDIAGQRRYKVTAFSLYDQEAARWDKIVQQAGFMECYLHSQKKIVKAKPDRITNDPKSVANCDIVLLTVPSRYHEKYFSALEPYVKDGTIFVVMPARSGCDFLFRKIMGAKAPKLGFAACDTLPWACRAKDWGRTTEVLGTKETVGAAVMPPVGVAAEQEFHKLQMLLGEQPRIIPCPNVMSISLGSPGQVVHPGITYSRWRSWDGKPLDKKPLFYHGADDFCASIVAGICDDIQAICKKLRKLDGKFDTSQVKTIHEFYTTAYSTQCKDTSTLQRAMVTNSAYDGLTHPMKGDDKIGYTPDFQFRYLSEDVPNGLCFNRGLAELLRVKTPTIDTVMYWCQDKLGKEFLTKGGRMAGKDIGMTRAPQALGITTSRQLLEFLQIKPVPIYKVPCATCGSVAGAIATMCSPA